MKICEQCYTSVYSKETEECPYCGAPFPKAGDAHGYVVPKAPTTKILLQFTAIAACLIFGIAMLNFVANSELLSKVGGCANNENCFLTALAICEVDVDVRPTSYGLTGAKILESRNGGCYVEVSSMQYNPEVDRDQEATKYCFFHSYALGATQMDDLFFCTPDYDATLLYDTSLTEEQRVDAALTRGVPEEQDVLIEQ